MSHELEESQSVSEQKHPRKNRSKTREHSNGREKSKKSRPQYEGGEDERSRAGSVRERSNSMVSQGIERDLKMKDTLDGTDVSSILNNLISRKRFITNWKTIINVMFKCVCRRRAH